MSGSPQAATDEDPQIGDVIGKRYSLEGYLGEGGMGIVFKARHVVSGRRVALKWFRGEAGNKELAARFIREARALGRIEHDNVGSVFDVGTVSHSGYLVMEALRGESLRELLNREAPLAPERAVALLIPAMQGVEAAHQVGVVHRDLKPENLFLCRTREGTTTRVLDFGVSKLRPEPHENQDTSLTVTGSVIGTPKYMAPEQVVADEVDPRTDVWALGVVLYEMLAGQVPFSANSYGAISIAIATEEPALLSDVRDDVPRDLALAVARALSKKAPGRFPTVTAMARAIEPFSG